MFEMPTAAIRQQFGGVDCDWMGCLACQAVWEPFPALYARDPVCADPCGNCAFRPGSPEQRDPEQWKELLGKLRPGGEPESCGMFSGHFYCHKGVPIDLTKGPGNFLFPKRALMMNGQPVRDATGGPAMIEDTGRMRTCSGFLRMVWAHNAKRGQGRDDAG